jgi:MFS family permease
MSHPRKRNRWVIPWVLAVTVFVHYIDRNNLAIALPQIALDFGWSEREIGAKGQLLMGAFYLTFGLMQVLLSPLAERWGPKRSLMAAIFGFSLCTILVYPLGGSLMALVGLRLLLGAAESVHMPMNSAIVSRWFAPHERGRANSIYGAGILVALAIAPLLIVPLVERFGWRVAFALLGLVGLTISLPLVVLFVDDSPSPEGNASLSPPPAPSAAGMQASFARDRRLWLYIAAGVLNAFCVFGVLNWLPTYLTHTKGITFSSLSLPLFGVFLAGIAGILGWAIVGDWSGRRVELASMGLFLAGWAVLATAFVSAPIAVIGLFALAVFLQSTYNAQEFATLQQILPPERVGAGTGLYNGLTVLLGGVGGSSIPGTLVSLTGDFQIGMLSLVAGAWCVALLMAGLSRWLHQTMQGDRQR